MNVRIDRGPSQVQISRRTMADFMIRAKAEEHARAEWDRLAQSRREELENYATALDATMDAACGLRLWREAATAVLGASDP